MISEAGSAKRWDTNDQRGRGLIAISLLTLFAIPVHGYHPYAEDGGLYLAGVKKVLDPALYGPHAEFVTEHLRFSFFAPAVAGLVLITRLPLAWVVLMLYVGSIWLTLFATWAIASRCVGDQAGRMGAVTLMACWLTMPIAGTSLMLMDPYVTARSFTTPLVLLTLAWMMDAIRGLGMRSYLLATGTLGLAATLHPLMAGYGAGAALMMAVLGSSVARVRRWGPLVLAVFAMALAAWLQVQSGPESAEYLRVVMTRYYWFIGLWHWYEVFGAIAPLGVIALLVWQSQNREARLLAYSTIVLGMIAIVVAILFARANLSSHAVARLQPLRCLQIVYEVMIVLLGAWTGERWLRASAWRWACAILLLGGVMFAAQRCIYPASAHLEMPWSTPTNPWERAFLWVRDHTPKDAVFALDARYITSGRGEDAQGFRAIAERDALPDYSKDGGEASISPTLTAEWVKTQAAQSGIDMASDAARVARLKPLGATWAVLNSRSATQWQCPYRNDTVKVCRLP